MKIKEVFSKMSWSGFFPNLLGVILGILLTFGINELWKDRQENKKTKELLVLVKHELENNKRWLSGVLDAIQKERYVYGKILEVNGKWDTIPPDTLKSYYQIASMFSQRELSNDAWLIFQNSDVIQRMSNRDLLVNLSYCYFWFNRIDQNYMNSYKESRSKFGNYELDPVKYFDAVIQNKESVFFYTMFSKNDDSLFMRHLENTIDITIERIEKELE